MKPGLRVAQVGTCITLASAAYCLLILIALTDGDGIPHPVNLMMWMLGYGFVFGWGVGPLLATAGWWWTRGTRWEIPTLVAMGLAAALWTWLLLATAPGI